MKRSAVIVLALLSSRHFVVPSWSRRGPGVIRYGLAAAARV
jgi:hypothetical protein